MGFADVDRILKALQVRVRQVERRLGKQDVVEELTHLEAKRAFVIHHRRTCHGGGVLGCSKPVLPLLAALEQVTYPCVTLGRIVQVSGQPGIRVDTRQRKVFPVGEQRGIRAQVRGHFLGLVLRDRGSGGQQTMVVLGRQPDGVFECDLEPPCRRLAARRTRQPDASESGTRHTDDSDVPNLQLRDLSFQRSPPVPGECLYLLLSRHKT